jgi:DNA-directed RNA polymerase specialized sigma54-like protein
MASYGLFQDIQMIPATDKQLRYLTDLRRKAGVDQTIHPDLDRIEADREIKLLRKLLAKPSKPRDAKPIVSVAAETVQDKKFHGHWEASLNKDPAEQAAINRTIAELLPIYEDSERDRQPRSVRSKAGMTAAEIARWKSS